MACSAVVEMPRIISRLPPPNLAVHWSKLGQTLVGWEQKPLSRGHLSLSALPDSGTAKPFPQIKESRTHTTCGATRSSLGHAQFQGRTFVFRPKATWTRARMTSTIRRVPFCRRAIRHFPKWHEWHWGSVEARERRFGGTMITGGVSP